MKAAALSLRRAGLSAANRLRAQSSLLHELVITADDMRDTGDTDVAMRWDPFVKMNY